MKIVILDPFSGISGDMMLGALIDLGASVEYITEHLERFSLVPDGTKLEIGSAVRHAIRGTSVHVVDAEGRRVDRIIDQSASHVHVHEHDHEHDGSHHHDHSHSHDSHDHGSSHEHHHVTYRGIADAISASELPRRVKTRSHAIFAAIAEGEARVHGMSVDDVHFHEVGAVDSIVDIIGVALALESLEIDSIFSRPVSIGGGGFIRSQHGTIPVPAPATLEILRGCPVIATDLQCELTTPTGAGIIRALTQGTAPSAFVIDRTGFGAGSRDMAERPNLLRAILCSVASPEKESESSDTVVLLETNIDDMNPEAWPLVFERLFERGALDVWLTSIVMKKGRPGQMLSVLSTNEYADEIERVVLLETTTIGVRRSVHTRVKSAREVRTVDSPHRQFRVKSIVTEQGEEIRPEAEDVIAYAKERNLPFHVAYDLLKNLAQVRD